MVAKKISWFLPIFTIVLLSCVIASSAFARSNSLQSQLLDHAGKSYTGDQDPSYRTYDLSLREYMAERIHKRFGIALNPKIYSGFDLLEIEALFKYKKPQEPFDLFLKMFPKGP